MRSLLIVICTFCLASAFGDENSIDAQIEILSTQIHEKRLEIMKAEVKSEDYIKGNWDKYSDTIKQAEKKEQELQALELQLKNLQAQKNTHNIN